MPKEPLPWFVLGTSVQGLNHQMKSTCNQDSIHWFPENLNSFPCIVSVADGHGSDPYYRSGIGARLAIEAVEFAFLKGFLEYGTSQDDLKFSAYKQIQETLEIRFPTWVWEYWKNAVFQHIKYFSSAYDDSGQLKESKNVLTPYGSTLASVMLCPDFVVYSQLGDGKIVAVSNNGEAYEPLTQKEIFIANEAPSLSKKGDSKYWEIKTESLVEGVKQLPSIIVISTDGMHNAFNDKRGFLEFGEGLYQLLNPEKEDAKIKITDLGNKMDIWARDYSNYSGDDVTFAIIARRNLFT